LREIDNGEGWLCPSAIFHGGRIGGPARPRAVRRGESI